MVIEQVCLYNERYLGSPSNRDEKGVATSATCSISHPACPRVKGVVRGCLNVGVTVFREVDDGKVRAAMSSQCTLWHCWDHNRTENAEGKLNNARIFALARL